MAQTLELANMVSEQNYCATNTFHSFKVNKYVYYIILAPMVKN